MAPRHTENEAKTGKNLFQSLWTPSLNFTYGRPKAAQTLCPRQERYLPLYFRSMRRKVPLPRVKVAVSAVEQTESFALFVDYRVTGHSTHIFPTVNL